MHPVSVPLRLALAGPAERDQIYRIRHEIYAVELGQHQPAPDGRLTDALDPVNDYLVALAGSAVVGFVSITPPSAGRWSLDKYLDRRRLPGEVGESVFEVRLLTVSADARGGRVAGLLMAAALHRIRVDGGDRVIGMGRQEVLAMYRRAGLNPIGISVTSGAVHYEVMTATVDELLATASRRPGVTATLLASEWAVPDTPAPTASWCGPDVSTALPVGATPKADHEPADDGCFHGGAFFTAIGENFTDLDRRHGVVNADVLDAWFPPAPGVVQALSAHLPWLLRTSPPTAAGGLVAAIAELWSVPPAAVLPGAGSSALIYLAFGRWLTASSRVLLPDPSYGEYAHVLERVIGCRVDRYRLSRADSYDIDPMDLARRAAGYDLLVLVNPNSPTGRFVDTDDLREALATLPATTRVWVDETYLAYAQVDDRWPAGDRDRDPGPGVPAGRRSLATAAAASPSIFVVTSMSKAYALSGARVAHLIGPPGAIAELRRWSPPWAVGLPTQLAAVRALADPDHYRSHWRHTAVLRGRLTRELAELGWDVIPATANFVLAHLPPSDPTAADLVRRTAATGVFLRDVGSMGSDLGDRAVRVAVKDEATLDRILTSIRAALIDGPAPLERRPAPSGH